MKTKMLYGAAMACLVIAACAPAMVPLAIKFRLLIPCQEVESCAAKHGLTYTPYQPKEKKS